MVHGRPLANSGAAGQQGSGAVIVLDGTELIAVAEVEGGWLRPTVVLGTGVTPPAPRPRCPAAPLPARDGGDRRLVRWRPSRPPGGAPRDRRAGRGGGAGQRAGHLRAPSARGGEPAGRAAAAHHGAGAARDPGADAARLRLLPPVRPAGRGDDARGVRARRAAGALRDAGAGDRARSRLRPRPERRRGDPAPPRRLPRVRGGRGAAGGLRRPARLQLPGTPRGRRRRPGQRRADAGAALHRERTGGTRGASRPAARRADHQPGRRAARRSCSRPTGCTRSGWNGAAAGPAG